MLAATREMLMLATVATDIHARWREKGSMLMHLKTGVRSALAVQWRCGAGSSLTYHSNIEGSVGVPSSLASQDTRDMRGKRTNCVRPHVNLRITEM